MTLVDEDEDEVIILTIVGSGPHGTLSLITHRAVTTQHRMVSALLRVLATDLSSMMLAHITLWSSSLAVLSHVIATTSETDGSCSTRTLVAVAARFQALWTAGALVLLVADSKAPNTLSELQVLVHAVALEPEEE